MGALLSVSLVVIPAPGWAAESDRGLREVGLIPARLNHTGANAQTEFAPPQMIVDTEHNLGFAIGNLRLSKDVYAPSAQLVIYDLQSLRLVDHIEVGSFFGSDDISGFTVDAAAERLLEPTPAELVDPTCAGNPHVNVIEYGAVGGRRKLRKGQPVAVPCPGLYRIVPRVNSVYVDSRSNPPTRKLYVYGTYVREVVRGPVPALGLEDNDGQPLIIQQIDLAKLDAGAGAAALDWQLDLRYAGCGRMAVPFVQRAGSSVFSYCSDARPGVAQSGNLSEQGYVVRIPLDEHEQPATVGGPRVPDPEDPAAPAAMNFLVRRTPALAGTVVPFADPATGTVLLLSNDSANGNATWVFDPIAERFVGVITGGYADQPADKTAAGFDPIRGRTYLFTSAGMLMAQTRLRPLATGTIYDVVSRSTDRAWVHQIAVAPKLRRLFVPLARDAAGKGRGGWVVVEDNVPDPPPPEPEDPDRNTAQIEENVNDTRVETRGAATASGAHLLAVGGTTRTLNQTDPLCDDPAPGYVPSDLSERSHFDGRCVWEVLFASGNREMFFAVTAIEAGTTTGAIAEGSGLAFAESDHTDQDVKRASECYRNSFQDSVKGLLKAGGAPPDSASSFQPLFAQYQTRCEELQAGLVSSGGPDLAAGTRGPDDKGFPVTRSECAAFEKAETDQQPPEWPLQFSSIVTCDPAAAKATAEAAGAGLALPGVDDSIVFVARMTSSVKSVRTERGQETIVEAVAEGVQIGPLRIGQIRTMATTRAKGRANTAAAEIVRRWCRVQLEGQPPIEDCVDPTSPETRALIDQVNQALGRIRVSVPEAQLQASGGGYQAVVTKHPDVRAADVAVNDDDSHTVSGLQIVVYNDGPEGRNRTVLQLAGVHAESRYGIQPTPELTPSILHRLSRMLDVPPPLGSVSGPSETPPDSLVKRVIRAPAKAIRGPVTWLVNNPREFALLFLLLTILVTPGYLTIRRRFFEKAVTS